MRPTMPRFSSAAATPLRLLAQNTRCILGDYAYGKIHNVQNVKDNALLLSSLIQVMSRIFVANQSAYRDRHKPNGSFRYSEAMKTTFREILGFTFSFLVLRKFQRGTIDFFRNCFFVKSGLSSRPTLLNGLFRKLFQVPASFKPSINKNPFPGFRTTSKRLQQAVTDFRQGTQRSLKLKPITGLFPDVVENKGVLIDSRGLANYKKFEPLVNWIGRITGNEKTYADLLAKGASPDRIRALKLQTFFEWFPAMVGSIPALFFSGFLLERFSQNYAEPLAQKIARLFGKTPPASNPPQNANGFGYPQSFPALDRSGILPYASNTVVPATDSGLMFHGYAPLSGIRSIPAQWAWDGSNLSRH